MMNKSKAIIKWIVILVVATPLVIVSYLVSSFIYSVSTAEDRINSLMKQVTESPTKIMFTKICEQGQEIKVGLDDFVVRALALGDQKSHIEVSPTFYITKDGKETFKLRKEDIFNAYTGISFNPDVKFGVLLEQDSILDTAYVPKEGSDFYWRISLPATSTSQQEIVSLSNCIGESKNEIDAFMNYRYNPDYTINHLETIGKFKISLIAGTESLDPAQNLLFLCPDGTILRERSDNNFFERVAVINSQNGQTKVVGSYAIDQLGNIRGPFIRKGNESANYVDISSCILTDSTISFKDYADKFRGRVVGK